MSKLSNALLMLQLLENGRKYSISELSDLLEVSERMIRKYKEELELAGIFIESIRGPYGGYVLDKSVNVPNMVLTEQDLKIVNELKKTYKGTLFSKNDIENFCNKVKVGIIKTNDKKIPIDKINELDVFNKISFAYKNNFKLRIDYFNKQHGKSIRTIYPLGLYLFEGDWWLSAYWEEKDDMRQFHLLRIHDCEVLKEKFDPKSINVKF